MFMIAYIENIFPPAPSDMLLVFGGTMIGFGTVEFPHALVAATLGSTTGFMSAYLLGRYFEGHIVEGRVGALPANRCDPEGRGTLPPVRLWGDRRQSFPGRDAGDRLVLCRLCRG
jgi:hypothetical protein